MANVNGGHEKDIITHSRYLTPTSVFNTIESDEHQGFKLPSTISGITALIGSYYSVLKQQISGPMV